MAWTITPYDSGAPVTEPGPVGRRMVQYLVDAFLVVAGALVGVLVLAVVGWVQPGELLAAVLGVVTLLAILGWYGVYWILLPGRSNGQTPGMRLLGLRVVALDTGLPATARQHGVRLLALLFVDGIGAGLVGLLVMVATPRRQRVGDLLARTVVVETRGAAT